MLCCSYKYVTANKYIYMNVYTCNTNVGFDSRSITWNQDFISFPHLPAKEKYASVWYCSICFVQISESNIHLELYICASFTKQPLFSKRIIISRWKYLVLPSALTNPVATKNKNETHFRFNAISLLQYPKQVLLKIAPIINLTDAFLIIYILSQNG